LPLNRASVLSMRERSVVHLALRWGNVTLRTACVGASGRFVLGEGGDWEMPPEALGVARFELLRSVDGALVLFVPPAATARVTDGRSPFRPPPVGALAAGSRAQIAMGALSVDVEVGLAEPRFRHGARLAADALPHHVLSLALHMGILVLLASLASRLGPVDAEEYADDVAFLRNASGLGAPPGGQPSGVAAEDEEGAVSGQGSEGPRGGGTGSRARGEEGSPGTRVSTERVGHVAAQGRHDEPDPHLAREAVLHEATAFSLLYEARPRVDTDPPSSPWGRITSQGTDRRSARAPLWGTTVADAFAAGGLALSGAGEGGGGEAEAMGLGDIGALGRGDGGSTRGSLGPGDDLGGAGEGGDGRGEGLGIGGRGTKGMTSHGSHQVRAPRICGCGGTRVNGRLPPEVIQRIVRQNFGRFRLCYEPGLDRNPALRGRVTTRFVIARDGSVAYAADGGSDLPDAVVSSCVVRSFSSLSFPEPAGGVVVVEYPVMLSPE
jgi:hypothetical protein